VTIKPTALHAAKQPDNQHVAAKQLEAFFLRRLLAEARPTGGDGIDGGFANDTFKQMLDEAIADKMSAAGGIGMAEKFAAQLGSKPTETHVPMPMMPMPTSRDQGPQLDGLPRLVMPVAGTPTSGYGMRTDPIKHQEIRHPGFDLAARIGTEVDAAAAGDVTHAGPAGSYGNLVTVRHGNGVETRYAHLSATTVKEGDHVEAGQAIGNVGTTGYSTGPHLHFEVRKDGQPIDPAPLLPLNTGPARSKR
jgi:murein DD-endopeptidase MepM/ murein hydrolase activator NlpD